MEAAAPEPEPVPAREPEGAGCRPPGSALRGEPECPPGPAGGKGPGAPGRCSRHGQPLQLYCREDGECVCGPGTAAGSRTGHTLLSPRVARAHLKGKLLSRVKTLFQTQQTCHFKYQDLKKSENEIKAQVAGLKGSLSKKFAEWRESLEEGEADLLAKVDEEGLRLLTQSSRCSEMLEQKMALIQQIDDGAQDLAQAEPLAYIQAVTELLSKASEIRAQKVPNLCKDRLNMGLISRVTKELVDKSMAYHSAITSIISDWAQLTLDPKTAYWFLTVSEDGRALTFGYDLQPCPSHPERFRTHRQILCCQSFASGYHAWAVEAEGISWGVGVAYGSIPREGLGSDLASSEKAWCLHFSHGTLTASHHGDHTEVASDPASNKFRVELDYEAGRLSFYQVARTLRHLHTFRATFTEPVFPAFSCFYVSSLKLC